MKRRVWLGSLVGMGVVLLFSAAFLLLFERVEEEVDIAPTGAARDNPFLAAAKLLSELGIPTRSVRGTLRLPPTDHVLVMVATRRHFATSRVEEIVDWVERGGHVIVAPKILEDKDEAEEQEAEEQEGEEQEVETEEAVLEGLLDPLLEALKLEIAGSFDQRSSTRMVNFQVDRRQDKRKLEIASFPLLKPVGTQRDQRPEVVVYLKRGQGHVTALSDASILRNDKIGNHQHAQFLWSLVTRISRPVGVWLVYQDRIPNLRNLLFKRAWVVLFSLALLLATWLWSRGARFGPRLSPPPTERRSLREHLGATAEFLWRRGQGASLVAGERRAVLHAVRHRYPAWNRLSEKDKLHFLVELSGVDGTSLADALNGSVAHQPETFSRMISTLEKVRRSL